MYIILRLQGLDVKAGAEDIRAFFQPLHIPDGGVYIVGGILREAFIAFTSERHAQLAMRRTGNLLKGSEVTMYISSMVELEHKLELLLNKKKKKEESSQLIVQKPAAKPTSSNVVVDLTADPTSSPAWPTDPDTANLPLLNREQQQQQQQQQAGQTLDTGTAFLLGICTVLQGLQSSQQAETNKAAESPKAAVSPKAVNDSVTPEQPVNLKPGYVRLFGLPASTTKEDICRFFSGLTVQEAIVNVQLGLNHGCLVKFANMQDARDALCFNQQLLGQICVEVRGGTEKMWNSALQECETASKVVERPKPEQNPLRENHKQKSPLKIKKRSVSPLPCKPVKKPKIVAAYMPPRPPARHIVMVSKLPKEINKTEIKELFGCPNISHKNVLHLLDKFGTKTDTAFLIFDRIEDYEYALNLSGCHVGSSAIQVSAITEQMMREKMSKARSLRNHLKMGKNPQRKPVENLDREGLTCMLVRNLPAHVQKGQIGRLFYRFRLTKESIVVLHDSNGNGLGEALVQFDSEKTAGFAYKMNGKKYLGAELLFTRISERQMDDILNKRV